MNSLEEARAGGDRYFAGDLLGGPPAVTKVLGYVLLKATFHRRRHHASWPQQPARHRFEQYRKRSA
jgi:hypothetical protein